MLNADDSILLSISGGADSIFMAHLFKEIEGKFKLKLGICYINHNLRDTKEEIRFVKEFAKKNNLPFFLGELKISKRSSLEELLRIKRLKLLKEIAKKNKFSKIALAHTKDDNSETILMRFLKGTSLRGLSGIKPLNEEIFIHPVLIFSKEEIINFLKERNIFYFQDPTNFDLSFLRNKLRHKILPYLEKEINPSLKENLINMSEVLIEDEKYLKEKAKEFYKDIFLGNTPFPKLKREMLSKAEKPIKNRIIMSILNEFDFRWETKHINLILDFIKEKTNKEAKFLNKYLTFITNCDNIYICPFDIPPEPFFLKKKGKIYLPGWKSTLVFSKKEGEICLEEDMIENIRITSLYYENNFKNDLKKLKIPYPLRKYLPIFAYGNKILWIPGFYKGNLDLKNKIYLRWNYEPKKNT